MDWYEELITRFTADRLVIIGSNQKNEYSFCNHLIDITSFK
jgi:hypothetical protein